MQKFFIQRALGSNETVEHFTHTFATLFCRAVTWLLCHKYFIFSTDSDSKNVGKILFLNHQWKNMGLHQCFKKLLEKPKALLKVND